MAASLSLLPPELYSAILRQVPLDHLQRTVLSLTRALPRSPIPVYDLFEHVRLQHPEQVIQLYRRLRGAPEDAGWVQEFALETWSVDADVVVNLVRILPKVKILSLFIGPNFTPEHLEEIFERPMPSLEDISLRFRPYVQKATYYQFLKGAYFDSTIYAFSRWPSNNLPTFSIVQDPLNPWLAPMTHFAQPLVFFLLDPFSTFVRSEFLRSLRHFRLRIPSRQMVRFICMFPGSLPSLQLLDLSSCGVLDSEPELILARFASLRHLIIDDCGFARGGAEGRDGDWAALGKSCALAGVLRAKEREKALKIWLESQSAQRAASGIDEQADAQTVVPHNTRRARRGRRGLATATISLRDSPPRDQTALPAAIAVTVPKVRVLPPNPSLVSLAVSTAIGVSVERQEALRAEFARGWAEGLAQLRVTRARLRQSWKNGVRVVRLTEAAVWSGEEGYVGLAEVESRDEEVFLEADVREGIEKDQVPILCLAGTGRVGGHVQGCGHKAARDVWRDDL